MRTLLIIISVSIFFACSGENGKNDLETTEQDKTVVEGIELTQEQIDRAGIITGKIEKRNISETIFCTGKISALPQNKANVSPGIGGFIKNLNYFTGNIVKKGDVLATLQHPDFIALQQKYMEAKAQTDYYYEEFKRQGELTIENAASIKNMQKAKSDYLSFEAQYKSLKAQLKLLNVDVAKIEQGDFAQYFYLKAPISGTIVTVNANTGIYVNPDTYIYEIVNDKQLNLELNVLEKDLAKVNSGQKIIFQSLNSIENFEAKVERISNNIDAEERSAKIFATIENKNQQFISGMFINAKILIKEENVYALPEEAILENEDQSMVFIENNNQFIHVAVKKGITQNGFCEIINPDQQILDYPVVIKGGYYLQSVLEITE